jgi:hypothetical protein
MKFLTQFMFMCAIAAGLAVSANAQKHDPKNRPKDPPPVITPGDKNKPKDPPKNNDGRRGPKKPGMAFLVAGKEIEFEI